jgi:hypothetical protein
VFHGVERPRVDEVVVPSTWREMGVGLVGTPREGIHYELNLTTSLDATAFGPQGFANGRGNASLQPAGSWQLAGRFEVEPFLGVLMGASGIVGDVGGALWGDTPFFDVNGDRLKLALPLYGLNFDARIRRFGLEARAVYVGLFLPNAGDLLQTRRADGSAFFPSSKVDGITGGAVPTRLQGVYLEVAYDVFRPFHFTTHQLLPFVRVEFYDTQEGVPDGFDRNAFFTVREATFGLSYRPIQQVVVKAEAQLRNRVLGPDELQANAGLGFMF